MPPSSRGPGRNPFKVKTGVRISMGAPHKDHPNQTIGRDGLDLSVTGPRGGYGDIPHSSTVPLSEAMAIKRASGEKTMLPATVTALRVLASVPLESSQTRSLRSAQLVRTALPSGRKA